MLIWITKGLAQVMVEMREQGQNVEKELNHVISYNLFTTITNANFDEKAFDKIIIDTIELKERLLNNIKNKENLFEATLYNEKDLEKDISKGHRSWSFSN